MKRIACVKVLSDIELVARVQKLGQILEKLRDKAHPACPLALSKMLIMWVEASHISKESSHNPAAKECSHNWSLLPAEAAACLSSTIPED